MTLSTEAMIAIGIFVVMVIVGIILILYFTGVSGFKPMKTPDGQTLKSNLIVDYFGRQMAISMTGQYPYDIVLQPIDNSNPGT